MSPERASRYARVAHDINQSVTGYVLGDVLTSLIAGVVVFITLAALRVPFPFLWALCVALVDFLPISAARWPVSRRPVRGHPLSAALQVITRELWQATAPGGTLSSEPGPGPLSPGPPSHTSRERS
jgi:hypothetical protein